MLPPRARARTVIRLIEKLSTDGSDRPRVRVVIANCGQIGTETVAAAAATQPRAATESSDSTAAAPGPEIEQGRQHVEEVEGGGSKGSR